MLREALGKRFFGGFPEGRWEADGFVPIRNVQTDFLFRDDRALEVDGFQPVTVGLPAGGTGMAAIGVCIRS